MSIATAVAQDRPLRYRPVGGAFVIENGAEFFNRPLYGNNTAFRVDAGDKPEFSLYLPGRGGNLRIGVKTADAAKWVHDAQHIVTRYHAATMEYEIRDPLLGEGAIKITALAMHAAEGLVLRVESDVAAELVWAYGGANGERGRRGGDIGTERLPVSQFFQLRPEHCRGSQFSMNDSGFVLQSRPGRIAGTVPTGSTLALADAESWPSPQQLLASTAESPQSPVVVGQFQLVPRQPVFLSLQRVAERDAQEDSPDYNVSQLAEKPSTQFAPPPAYTPDDLPRVFAESQAHYRKISERIVVETPDDFINAAAAALCVAADGIWDEPSDAFIHGAVAWRTKLLGWRGVYTGDALGWHDRTRRHLDNWLRRQNTEPLDPQITGADADANLARSERMLHTNGDLTASHYDMNLVAIDALFRHLMWTGDREYARQAWPVIKRHLQWERRLFRREFGAEKLPLYEAYNCIWASDNLQYSGGGVTHSTAYNYLHNKMAARIAEMLGEDSAPFEHEAELIRRAMQEHLWLADRGWFAEYKDLLGNQLVHPNAALWTYYHTIDSQAADAFEAWQMGRSVDTQIAHIPVQGAGVPPGTTQLATTTWHPYAWSINNVVMAETMHTSLADWQAGRRDEAFASFKGAILDSMFLGLCPGNVGMCTFYDANRHESQRDFADGIGITSRALVEGLFGIMPDALAGELLVRPGFPAHWQHASIRHADFAFEYRRDDTERFLIESKFPQPMKLRLRTVARAADVGDVTVNGKSATWKNVDDAVGTPVIEIVADAAPRWDVQIRWRGDAPATPAAPAVAAAESFFEASVKPAKLLDVHDPQQMLRDVEKHPDSLRAVAAGVTGHRTFFAKVQQGKLAWWMPVTVQVRPAYEILDTATSDAQHLRFRVRNNTADAIDGDIDVRVNQTTRRMPVRIAALSEAELVVDDADVPVPGTNRVLLAMDHGRQVQGMVTNWKIPARDASNLQPVDLHAVFNDNITQIFNKKYLSPRSPYCSLAIPSSGIGGWSHNNVTVEIDDSGLRAKAAENDGRFILPEGIAFLIPTAVAEKNVAFISQWDNHPRQITVPLGGRASHVYLLMAGSTNHMQSRLDNGALTVTYADGSSEVLPLHNPTNWWPIERDYFIDDYAFARHEPIPPRVDLRSGQVRVLDVENFKGRGGRVSGGAATVLDLPLDPTKELRDLTVESQANEAIIGLMAATLVR